MIIFQLLLFNYVYYVLYLIVMLEKWESLYDLQEPEALTLSASSSQNMNIQLMFL